MLRCDGGGGFQQAEPEAGRCPGRGCFVAYRRTVTGADFWWRVVDVCVFLSFGRILFFGMMDFLLEMRTEVFAEVMILREMNRNNPF